MPSKGTIPAVVSLLLACAGPGGTGVPDGAAGPGNEGFATQDASEPEGPGTSGDAGDGAPDPEPGDPEPGAPDGGAAPDAVQVGCETNEDCKASTPWCGSTNVCLECLQQDHCSGDEVCSNGVCLPPACQPGQKKCTGNALLTCEADQTWSSFTCIGGQCKDGKCVGCVPDEKVCQAKNVIAQCLPDGSTYQEIAKCAEDEFCVSGACKDCYPEEPGCDGSHALLCSSTGDWLFVDDCGSKGLSCHSGFCVTPCQKDIKFKSTAGCDYWAVDMDNHFGAQNSPYAVIVSNLHDKAATVQISIKDSEASITQKVDERQIAPGALEVFLLPPRQPDGAGLKWRAHRIQSNAPVIAYQFNPLDNVDVFSNDASLLLPVKVFGKEYIAVSRVQTLAKGPQPKEGESCESACKTVVGGVCLDDGTGTGQKQCWVPYRGQVVVLTPTADTSVTIIPTARTLPGEGIPVMFPGEEYTFKLEPYQILQIKSDEEANEDGVGGDLTGTVVKANKSVAVFGGHDAAFSGSLCCADHLEHQLFPVSTWGKEYLATKSSPRGVEDDYWRVVASLDETTVTFTPASVSPPIVLQRGEWAEIATPMDFKVTSDKPITLAQLLASSQEILTVPKKSKCDTDADCHPTYDCIQINALEKVCNSPMCTLEGSSLECPGGHVCHCFPQGCTCSPVGDPTLLIVPPIQQFRTEYVFLSPNKYLEDYINVVAPTEASATLDAQPLPAASFVAIPGTGYKVARIKVGDGVHKVSATHPVGVMAYGYDRDVSYGYAAGLSLEDL